MANTGWERAERAWNFDQLRRHHWDPRGSTPDVRPPYRASYGPEGYDPAANWAAARRPEWGVRWSSGLGGYGMEGAPGVNRPGGFGPEGGYGAAAQTPGSRAGLGPRNWRRPDRRIEEDVNEALTRDPHLDPTDIEVSVKDGEVTLTGAVHDRDAKRRAEDDAEACSGVHDVHNRLVVVP